MKLTISLALLLTMMVCERGATSSPNFSASAHAAETSMAEEANSSSSATAAQQDKSFIPVEGPNLQAKLDAAIKRGRSASAGRNFWVGYAFNIKHGVGIDTEISGIQGNINLVTGLDPQQETRNVGVFLFFEPANGKLVLVELHNLDRQHDFGNPVYWLGRAGNQESLTLLQNYLDSQTREDVAGDLTVAIAVHDDPQVLSILKNIYRRSPLETVRLKAVTWIGREPGQVSYLADIARDEHESFAVRERAVMSIGKNQDAGAIPTLQTLYQTLTNRDLKRRAIDSAIKNVNHDEAVKFITAVAQNETDNELRERARRVLWKKAGRNIEWNQN